MKAKYELEFRVSGSLAVQIITSGSPFAVLFNVLEWASDHHCDICGVTIRRNQIVF